ncbi:MAG: T9SS type A sorting domain-containing protein [Bacteroidia bacterium]|nr:T9SS type A sorting domain-containing protein [Bacteroidia bacterium]
MMKRLILFSLLLPLNFLAQPSTVHEQSLHYKKFQYTKDTQWDSLNTAETGQIYQNNLANKSMSNCTLTKKVYGWHPYWVGSVYNNYNWDMLSDFCYFDYSVSPTTGNNTNGSFAWATSAAVTAAISHSINVHFCATLFSSHSTFWGNPTAQQTFITNAINLLNSRPGSNGINIDFEGMGSSDKVPFTTFMTNLCNQVHAANPNYKVTMALYAVDWSTSFDIPALNSLVDNFIIMGYDYYYSGSSTAGPEAPLYNFQTSYNYTLSKSITYYLKQGASKNKLLLGLPWYGREWETNGSTAPSNTTGGFTSSRTYSYVKNNPAIYSVANKNWESICFNPYYSYQVSGNWRQCWIDDIYSYSRKFDMVNQRGIGGIGIWALGYDDGYTDLWDLIQQKFSTCATTACTDSIFDMGGPSRNYYDNENYVYTIAPTGANQVKLNFSYAITESNYDTLYVFDGATVASPTLGVFTGTTNTSFTLTSTTPSVTIKFKSDGATNRQGYKAVWQCIQDNMNPTTQINTPSTWITQNFTTTYTDADNSGGSGIEKSFYQASYFNGIEWRANGNRGFFNDDFNTANIHSDWTNSVGTWSIVSNAVVQSDETNSNTNLYAAVTQSLSNRYLYCFKGTITGSQPSRRAGIHIFCDNPTQTNRGNNYLIWMRPDQGTIELYKNVNDVLGVVKTVTYAINAGTTYDYKISYDRILGELQLWINDTFITSWIDSSPFASGSYVSFRSGNCNFKIDDFKVFRSRAASHTILVGAANTNDLRNENPSPLLPAGKIASIVKDNANNLSSIASQTLNIDWTKPITTSLIVNNGTATDIDTTYIATQLDLNYTVAKDTNSAINAYYYAIGTTPGGQDISPWTNNSLNTSATKTGLNLQNNQLYYVSVKVMNGAGIMSDSVVCDGVLYLMPTDVKNINLSRSFKIYPNPSKGLFYLEYELQDVQENTSLEIMNVLGAIVIEQNIFTKTTPVDISHLSGGAYTLTILQDGKTVVNLKLIKE